MLNGGVWRQFGIKPRQGGLLAPECQGTFQLLHGAAAAGIVIGHLGNLHDPNTEIQRAIIRRGAFIGFDRQGGASDDPVAAMAMSLIQDGYGDHLMFSADIAQPREIRRNNPEGGYAKTLTVFVPKVKKLGATDEVLHQIMVDNPRRFLAHVPKVKRKA